MEVVGVSQESSQLPSSFIHSNANMLSVSSDINKEINSPRELQSKPPGNGIKEINYLTINADKLN